MDKLSGHLAEIFEVDQLNPDDILDNLDLWDSLTQLSIISLADEEYGITISALELREARTVGGILNLFEQKRKG